MEIGIVLPLAENRSLGRPPRYTEMREMALQTEAAGFDSIWLYDHLLYRSDEGETTGIWECWTILSALAEATQRVTLGSMVLCNSFRNPAITAKMAATLDEVSNGRFVLGIGAGWNKPEFDAFGIPFDRRASRFEEALQIIRPLLKEGYVDFKGNFYQAIHCELTPRGPRAEGPPLLVGGFGPRMLRLAAKYADMWNTGYLHQPSALVEPLAKMEAACAEVGRDLATLAVTSEISLGYPDLGELPQFMENYLSGSAADVAEAVSGFEQMGVQHLMFRIEPYTAEAVNRLAMSVREYRQRTAA